jgi:septum formation protein
MIEIILASSSPYRKQLLKQLNLDFSCVGPNIDETPKEGETASKLVARLAEEKARKVAEGYPDDWIIGSDQCASFDGTLIGKPGSVEAAVKQLQAFSGNELIFYTSVCLFNRNNKHLEVDVVETKVAFRTLSDLEITEYVAKDNPIDCAGSFKAESLGISLFEELESKDPTALIGLPLISLCRLMRDAGIF